MPHNDVEALARIERKEAARPFFRREYGQWAFRDMQQREALYAAVLEIFKGDTGAYLDPYPSETDHEARKKVGRFNLNLLMSFINKWNTLYIEEPTRVFEYDGKRLKDNDERAVVLSEQYRKAYINDIMEQADSMMRLTGVVAVRPWFDATNNELVAHLYSGNNIRVVHNYNNPRRPMGIALVGTRKLEESDGGSTLQPVAETYSNKVLGRLEGETYSTVPLETEEFPVAFGWEKHPTNKSGFFVDCPGPALAAIDRLLANDFISHLGFVTLMQGFGIPVTWGLAKGATLKIGPDATVDFDGDPDSKEDLEFRNPGAPLEEIAKIIERLIDWTRETYDIPKSMLDASMTSSGVAQVEANAPMGILRIKRAKQMRPLETSLVQRVADVLKASGVLGANLDPKKFGVSVYYPEPQLTKSTDKQIEEDKFFLELGVTTRAAIFMRENPDQFDTEEEAEKFLSSRAGMLDPIAENGDVDSPVSSPTPGSNPSPPNDSKPSDTAFNPGQIKELLEMVAMVSKEKMSKEAAIALCEIAFPTIERNKLLDLFTKAESFEPVDDTPPQLIPTGKEGTSDDNGDNKPPNDPPGIRKETPGDEPD